MSQCRFGQLYDLDCFDFMQIQALVCSSHDQPSQAGTDLQPALSTISLVR